VINGVELEYDTCLGINNSLVTN
jgi:hypothetical protein